MTIKEKIAALFSSTPKVDVKAEAETKLETVESKFANIKSADGSLIFQITEDLVEGAKVEVVNTDGSLTNPNSTGQPMDIALEGGKTITIDADGIITAIQDSPAAPQDENLETDKPTETPKENLEVEALIERLSNLETNFEALIAKLSEHNTELSAVKEENKNLKTVNEQLSKKPLVEPTNFKKFDEEIKTPSLNTNKKPKVNVELLAHVRTLAENAKNNK